MTLFSLYNHVKLLHKTVKQLLTNYTITFFKLACVIFGARKLPRCIEQIHLNFMYNDNDTQKSLYA